MEEDLLIKVGEYFLDRILNYQYKALDNLFKRKLFNLMTEKEFDKTLETMGIRDRVPFKRLIEKLQERLN